MVWISADSAFNADNLESPVIGIASDLIRHDSGAHQHEKGQFLFSEKGAMTLLLGKQLSVLPPQRLAWIPPNHLHRVMLTEIVGYRSIYIDPAHFADLPEALTAPQIWNVSPLLKAVLEVIAESPWETDWDSGRARNWLSVLWDELRYGTLESMHLALPQDYRLQKIDFQQLPPPLHALTATVGASEKTITRIFQKETGLGYQAWRQQWRLLKAIALLSDDLPLMEVAHQLGFASDTIFAQFFKRMTGKTPKQYL